MAMNITWGDTCSRFLDKGLTEGEVKNRSAIIDSCYDDADINLSQDLFTNFIKPIDRDKPPINVGTLKVNRMTAAPAKNSITLERYNRGLTWNQRDVTRLFFNAKGFLELRKEQREYYSALPWNWMPSEETLSKEGDHTSRSVTFAIKEGALVLIGSNSINDGEKVSEADGGLDFAQRILRSLDRAIGHQLLLAETRAERESFLRIGALLKAMKAGVKKSKERQKSLKAEVVIPTCSNDQVVECRCVEQTH